METEKKNKILRSIAFGASGVLALIVFLVLFGRPWQKQNTEVSPQKKSNAEIPESLTAPETAQFQYPGDTNDNVFKSMTAPDGSEFQYIK